MAKGPLSWHGPPKSSLEVIRRLKSDSQELRTSHERLVCKAGRRTAAVWSTRLTVGIGLQECRIKGRLEVEVPSDMFMSTGH